MGKRILLGLIAFVVLAAAGVAWLVMSKGNEIVASAIETYGSSATGAARARRDGRRLNSRARRHQEPHNRQPGGLFERVFPADRRHQAHDRLGVSRGPRAGHQRSIGRSRALECRATRPNDRNLTDIERRITGPATASKPRPQAAAKDDGRIIIDRFRLTHGRITLTSDLLKHPEELAELADVSIDGIGRASGGVTYEQAAEAVLEYDPPRRTQRRRGAPPQGGRRRGARQSRRRPTRQAGEIARAELSGKKIAAFPDGFPRLVSPVREGDPDAPRSREPRWRSPGTLSMRPR